MTGGILIIDDEASVRKILLANLKLSGFDVTAAADGEEGLAIIKSGQHPRLVITDIIMPNKNGIEVITDIRRLYPVIKIIAISGGGRIDENNDLLEKARTAGADAVLAKPLDLDTLEKTIEEFMA